MIRPYVNPRGANGPTMAFDEFGPLEIRPQPGRSWRRQGKPDRQPATCRRLQGVRDWLGFYDVHADKLCGYVRKRKRSREVLDVLRRMRRRYPADQRIHLILDNFSPRGTKPVKQWSGKNNVHLIWTPTNASWLNPIECQFTPVNAFVIRNTHYDDQDQLPTALDRHAAYQNKYAKRKP